MGNSKQRQHVAKRKRSLHDKYRRRRKRDVMVGMPFSIAYVGDPAMGSRFYCNDMHSFKLIGPSGWKPFVRLHSYQMKPIVSMFLVDSKILVKEAPLL